MACPMACPMAMACGHVDCGRDDMGNGSVRSGAARAREPAGEPFVSDKDGVDAAFQRQGWRGHCNSGTEE